MATCNEDGSKTLRIKNHRGLNYRMVIKRERSKGWELVREVEDGEWLLLRFVKPPMRGAKEGGGAGSAGKASA